MKRNFITLCTMVLSLAVLSSCSKADVETVEAHGQEVKFKVFSEETKTYLASGITNWSSNDIIYDLGDFAATIYTCDFSLDYVHINADYTT